VLGTLFHRYFTSLALANHAPGGALHMVFHHASDPALPNDAVFHLAGWRCTLRTTRGMHRTLGAAAAWVRGGCAASRRLVTGRGVLRRPSSAAGPRAYGGYSPTMRRSIHFHPSSNQQQGRSGLTQNGLE